MLAGKVIRSCVEDLSFCACRRQGSALTPRRPSLTARDVALGVVVHPKPQQEGEPNAHALERVNELIKPNQRDANYGHPFREGRNRICDRGYGREDDKCDNVLSEVHYPIEEHVVLPCLKIYGHLGRCISQNRLGWTTEPGKVDDGGHEEQALEQAVGRNKASNGTDS
jgi:hypothetical protein